MLEEARDIGPRNVIDFLPAKQRLDVALNAAPIRRQCAGFFGCASIGKIQVAELGYRDPLFDCLFLQSGVITVGSSS
jgi:hypothetical protein